MNINWQQAKKGDVGAMVAQFESEVVQRGAIEFVPSQGSRGCYGEGPDLWLYVERPKPWTGDGLPPIDMVCQFIGTNECRSNAEDLRQGAEVTIIAHYKQTNDTPLAAFTFIDGDGEKRIGGAMASCFAPPKSTEQIAAEEREAKAKEMYLSVYFAVSEESWDRIPEATRETFRKAIDAGWQQVAP